MIGVTNVGPPEQALAERDESTLIHRAQQDRDAFALLYRRHLTAVYRYVLFRVGNVDDAQDVTSQVFMEAMQHIARYHGPQPFVAWLLGIARHKIADHFRRRKPEADLEQAAHVTGNDDAPEDVITRTLAVEQVTRKLQVLAPDRAEALALRLFAGLEIAEIASLLGKNEPAVRMLVFRGLRDLQAQLGEDER